MQNEDKAKQNSANQQDWKARFNDLAQSFQIELKRTTQIGMKMLTASQSNSQLHEHYEALGKLAKEAMDKGDLTWTNSEAKDLSTKIDELRSTLEELEQDVENIKKS